MARDWNINKLGLHLGSMYLFYVGSYEDVPKKVDSEEKTEMRGTNRLAPGLCGMQQSNFILQAFRNKKIKSIELVQVDLGLYKYSRFTDLVVKRNCYFIFLR